MKRFTKKINRRKIVTIIILSVLLFIILFPLWWAITLSFNAEAITSIPKFSWLPKKFTLDSYIYAFDVMDLGKYYLNTLILCTVNTLIAVLFALISGYAFAKGRFFGKKFWYVFMLAVMMIPFESRMFPLYQQYAKWGLTNTWWPLIFGNFAYVYGIFFARQNIEALPDSLREAAKIDGLGEWGCFFKIILPLCKPVAASLSIIMFINQWNNFLWPLIVIRDSKKQLLSVGVSLFNASQYTTIYGPRLAVAVLGSLPLIIVFLFLQKYIVQSIALSGIKQ